MCQRIQANPAIKGTELDGLIDVVYARWQLMSKGCHPSGAGIRQTASERETRHNVGATYHRDLCLAAFDVGFFPVSNLLPGALMRLRPEAQSAGRGMEVIAGRRLGLARRTCRRTAGRGR